MNYLLTALLVLTAPAAIATPTMCEFIAVEVFEAADKGYITEAEAWDIYRRCKEKEQGSDAP